MSSHWRLLAFVPLLAMCHLGRAAEPAPRPVHVTGWVAFNYDFQNSLATFYNHADRFAEISPFWFYPLPDGSVTAYEPDPPTNPNAKSLEQVEPLVKAVCRAHGIKLLPCLGGPPEKYKDADKTIIRSPALRAAHIKALVALAVEHGYDGLDMDYESFKPEDRPAISAFMTGLGAALHAQGKMLTMAVHAKTAEPGDWDGPQAQDWKVLGAAVDRLRIMAYDFKEDSSEAGPIAPLDWYKAIIAFAVTQVAPAKIQIGIPVYGYDWEKPGAAEEVTAREAPDLAHRKGASLVHDAEQAAIHFTYTEDGVTHQVWYEDPAALRTKMDLARLAGLDGIAVWRFAEESPEFWSAVDRK